MATNERRISFATKECKGTEIITSVLLIESVEQLRRYLRAFYDTKQLTLYNVQQEPFNLLKAIAECSDLRNLNLIITSKDQFLETPRFKLHNLNIKSEKEIPYDILFPIIRKIDLNILQITNLSLSFESILNISRKNLIELYLTDVYVSMTDKEKFMEMIHDVSALSLRATQNKTDNGNFYGLMLEFLNDVDYFKNFQLNILGVQLLNLLDYDFTNLKVLENLSRLYIFFNDHNSTDSVKNTIAQCHKLIINSITFIELMIFPVGESEKVARHTEIKNSITSTSIEYIRYDAKDIF